MKAKLSYKSKRNIVISVIIVALLALIGTGTYFFVKGNDDTQAYTGDSISAEESQQQGQTEAQPNDGNGEQNPAIEGNDGENADQGQVADVDYDGGAANTGTTAQNQNAGANNDGTTTTTTTGNVPNQDYVTTRTEQQYVLTNQDYMVDWHNMEIAATTTTANLEINKPDLSTEKLAYLDGDSLEDKPINTAIQKGETITYVIKITNNGGLDANNIHIIDAIPEGTELVKDSITGDGIESDGKITWKTNIKVGETVTVSFKATVVVESITVIENTAKVNGEDTTTTKNPIITSDKQAAVVEGESLNYDRAAKVGETIRYTITATNNTEVAGTTTITDKVPEGTTLIEGTVTGKISEDGSTITWSNVTVPANGTKAVSFDVIVNKETQEGVTNKAVVGNTETTETETKVANITTTKSSVGIRNGQKLEVGAILHEFDVIEYTLTATNTGNGEGTVVITDKAPAGTTLVKDSVSEGGEVLEDGTITWNNVTVPANGPATVSFQVKVNKFEDKEVHIINDVAKQDGEQIPTGTDDKVEKEYVTVTVNKEFVDYEGVDGKRPTAVEFELYADGVATEKTAEANASNSWKVEFTELDKYTDNGELITYTVKENNVNEYYEASYDKTVNGDNVTVNVTNTLIYEKIKIEKTVEKKWDDNNNEDRPTEVVIGAYNNSETPVDTAKATSTNGWKAKFEGLQKYTANGEEITYTFKEVEVPSGYVDTVNENIITNALPRLEVTKIVKAINDEDATETDSATVNEGDIIEYEITVKNTGSVTVNNIQVIESLNVYLNADKPEEKTTTVGTIEKLEAGEQKTYTVYYKVLAGDVDNVEEDLVNVATATGKYTDGNDTETEVTVEGEIPVSPEEKNSLSITKSQKVNGEEVTDETKVEPGDVINYTITVTNTGNTVLNDVVVTDSMIGNENFVLEDTDGFTLTEGNLTIDTIGLNETKIITAKYTVQESDMEETESKIVNTATAKSDKAPEESSKIEVPTEPWYSEITTVKTSEGSSETLHELDTITYKLTATNNGTTAGSVVITDKVPEGTTLVVDSVSEGGKVSEDGTITWNNVTVPANGGEVTVSFQVTINPFESEDGTIAIVNDKATQDGTPINGTSDKVEKEYTSVTVNKTWEDNETQALRRPEKIRFELYADSTQVDEYDMSSTKESSYTFENLSKYNSDGTTIEYTVKETGDLKFYTSTTAENEDDNGNKTYNITNTFTRPTDTKDITVTKVWNDNNDAADKRPDSILLKLNDEEITLTATENADSTNGNIWSTKLEELPVYNDNGEEIEYTLTEENVPQWYTSSVKEYTVTNTFVAPTDKTHEITITKVWDDNNNEAKKRPEEITLTLNKIDVNGNTVKVNDVKLTGSTTDTQWTVKENVQKYDEKANEIKYFVTEEDTGSIFYINSDTDKTDLTVTNTFKVPDTKANITVRKIWNDNNNNASKREAVEFAITGNGKTEKVELTSANANATDGNIWETTVNTLPKYDSLGNEIEYKVDEVKLPDGYIKTVDGNVVTNSLPGIDVTKTVISVTDENGKTSIPEDVKDFAVKENDVIEYQITVTNLGTVDLTNVNVTDSLNVYTIDPETKVETQIANGTLLANGTFAAGETETYTVYYKVTAANVKDATQTLINTATASGTYTDSNNKPQTIEKSANVEVKIKDTPKVEIVKEQIVNGKAVTSDTRVEPGDVINYTITVTNTGNTVLNNVVVTDSMAEREGFAISEDSSLNIGTLGIAPNNVATITATYTVQESDMSETAENKITNIATVSTSSTDDVLAKVEVTTKVWKTDIKVSKTGKLADGTDANAEGVIVKYGETITYTLEAKNDGTKVGTQKLQDTDLQKLIEGYTDSEGNSIPAVVKDVTNIKVTDFDENGNARTSTKTYNDIINGIDVNVPAGKTATVEFTVTVIANAGMTIENSVVGGNNSTVTTNVEKVVKVKKNTITNCNVVIVLDLSKSMTDNKVSATQTRLDAAKAACVDLIDNITFDEEGSSTGSAVSVVTFSSDKTLVDAGRGQQQYWSYYDNATTIGTATTEAEAAALKTQINGLSASGGTRIAAGLDVAKEQIESLSGERPNNKDIVIVISDGDFKLASDNDTLLSMNGNSTGEETKSRVESYAAALKGSSCNPVVYAIAYGSSAISSDLNLMRDSIASNTSTYLTASDSLSGLTDALETINEDLTPAVDTLSTNGLIELTDIDINKEITIKVNSVAHKGTYTATNSTEGDLYIQSKITHENGSTTYYLDLSKFNADDTVEITYCVDANQ